MQTEGQAWDWGVQGEVCGVREPGNLWNPFQLWVVIKKPALGRAFPAPKFCRAPDRRTQPTMTHLSAFFRHHANVQKFHKEDSYFNSPTDSSGEAFQDMDPKGSKENPATHSTVKMCQDHLQGSEGTSQSVRSQVSNAQTSQDSQKAGGNKRCGYFLPACEPLAAPASRCPEAVTLAARCRITSDQGSSP